MGMKGISISINAFILLVLGIFVFMAVVALFSGVWSSSSESIDCQAELRNFCLIFTAKGCCSNLNHDCVVLVKNFDQKCQTQFGITYDLNADTTNINQYCCT